MSNLSHFTRTSRNQHQKHDIELTHSQLCQSIIVTPRRTKKEILLSLLPRDTIQRVRRICASLILVNEGDHVPKMMFSRVVQGRSQERRAIIIF